MNERQILSFRTSIIVKADKDELLERYASSNKRTVYVFHTGRMMDDEEPEVLEVQKPLYNYQLTRLLNLLCIDHVYDAEILEETITSSWSLRIAGYDLAIYSHSDEGCLDLSYTSFHDNIDGHYRDVNEIKAQLINDGIEIVSGSCELEERRKCG